jgi:acyl-coenzyme A thioesterase PaaI-like protein
MIQNRGSDVEQNTHHSIDPRWVGAAVELRENEATATLTAVSEMAADTRGLVHGGFTFGLADFAAMLAVNDPNVVLGAAETRFLAPVQLGEVMVATAKVVTESGKKRSVEVTVHVADKAVMKGVFTCFVLPKHVLDI